jgi:SAM-dependent methyltransferase
VANQEMIRLWNNENADRWTKLRESVTRSLEPYGDAALSALAPKKGESALDVGCGFGETTTALARLTGDALGIDVSEPLLRVARTEAPPGARYLVADAQTHRFDERFQLCFSRFGIMFFDDPAAAFRNLRSAMKPGGRLAAVVWAPVEKNDWASIPLRVVRQHLAIPDPAAGPGPFALSDAKALVRTLEAAGWSNPKAVDLELPFQEEPAALLDMGVVGARLRQMGEAADRLRPLLAAELEKELPKELRGVALLVTASVDTSSGIQ